MEKKLLIQRILDLPDKMIMELFGRVGIHYPMDPIQEILAEVRYEEEDSINLDVLIREADSRENLLKWLSYFEKPKIMNGTAGS